MVNNATYYFLDDGSRSGVAVKQELVPVEIEIENAVYSINNINQSINHIM